MDDMKELVSLAEEAGFTFAGELNVKALEFLPEVRVMCNSDKCRSFGRNWSCPPACGTLEDIADRARKYDRGILVQTTGSLEDDFDIENMMETEARHKQNFRKLHKSIRARYRDCLPMAAGTCTICPQCTYPDAPCRFPEEAAPSMEAYGLFVSRVCEQSGIKYNYGPRTITYTSCFLLE